MPLPETARDRAWWFALATIAFGTSYALLPLYSSNQNHHFLIGLARAGDGLLREDWLASTRDPFPLFTAYVSFVHRFLFDWVHYIVYYLLLGAYAYGLIGIVEHVWPPAADMRTRERLLFLAIICVLHNEVVGYLLGFGLAGMPWWQMTHWGVAEQEIFGHSAFQGSSFGLLLPLAIRWFLERRSSLAAALVGAVVAIHFSYAITAAALLVGFILVERLERRGESRRGEPIAIAAIALAFMLPAAIYVGVMFAPTSADVARRAASILTTHLPQETDAAVWFGVKAALQIVLMIAGIGLALATDLFLPLLATFVTGAALSAIQMVTRSPQLALVFPWRVSVLLVPIATALVVRFAIVRLRAGRLRAIGAVSAALIGASMIAGGVRMVLNFAYYDDIRPLTARLDPLVPARLRVDFTRAMRPETLPMMDFVRRTLQHGDLYVIPADLERFRLRSGAPALADSKSHPYKDREVLEWATRLGLERAFYLTGDCLTLQALVARYGVTHVVLDERFRGIACEGLQRVYADSAFDVYQIGDVRLAGSTRPARSRASDKMALTASTASTTLRTTTVASAIKTPPITIP